MTYSKLDANLKVNYTYYTDSSCKNKVSATNAANNVEGGAPIEAGNYYVIGVTEDNKNYNTVTSQCTLGVTINKVNAVCPQISSYVGNYNGELHTISVTKDAVGGTAMYCTNNCENEDNWSIELPKFTNGGTVTVNIKVVGDNSHDSINCDSATIDIRKIPNTITVTNREVYYTSERIEVEATAYEHEIDPLFDVTYYSNPSCTNEVEPIDVGTYYVQITVGETANYSETSTSDKEATSCPEALTIKKVNTTTSLDDIEKVYNGTYKNNGTPQLVDTATSKFNSNNKNISESTNDTPSYQYYYYNEAGCYDDKIMNEYAPTNVGTYSVKAVLNGTDNYASSEACATYEMKKAPDLIEVTEQVVAYNGDSSLGVVATPANSAKGNVISYTYYTDSGCSAESITTTSNAVGEGKEPFAVGTYYVKATTELDNENTNYEFVTVCQKAIEITPVDTVITCRQNIIYNGDVQDLAECNGGKFENNEVVIGKKNAGSYSLTCTGDGNHSSTTKTCTIAKADTLTIVNGNDSNLLNQITRNYQSGMRQGVNKETDNVISKLANKTDVTFTGDYNYEYYEDSSCAGTALGGAPIDVRVNNQNEAIPYYVKVTLEGTTDYNTSNVCVPFMINKIHSTITVNNRDNIAYTGNVVTASATSTSNSNITFEYYTDEVCSHKTTVNDNGSDAVGTAPRNGGTYYVRATSAETSNYLETTTDCAKALSIKAVYATCPEITSYNGVYDGNPHHVTVGDTTNIGGSLRYKVDDQYYGTNGEWVVDPPTRTVVGTSVVQIKVEGDDTHLTQTCDDKEVTITKKLDVITINPDTVEPHVVEVTYDGSHHEATVSSESHSNITTTYYTDQNCSTQIAGTPINVGTYYVRATSTGNENYDSNSKCGLAVIINKKASVCPPTRSETIVPYDGNTHKIEVSGNYEGGTLEFKKANGSWSTTNPTIRNVSESTTVSVRIHNTDGNYEDADCGTYNLTINKVSPEINCTNPTYTNSSLNIATSIGCSSLSGNSQTNAGSYTVTCTGDGNHLNKSTTCNINKSNTTTSIPEQNKTYNGNTQEATNPSSNLSSTNATISGATHTFTYYLDNMCTEVTTTPKYGGIYYVVAKLEATTNYNSSLSPCTKYTMNQNKPKVTISCTNPTYNGNPQTIATCSSGGTIVTSTSTRTDAGSYVVYCYGDDEHSNADPKTCTISKANPTCPGLASVTTSYDEHPHYLTKTSEAVGGVAEYKLSRCQYENHTSNNISPDCSLVWTSTFMPDTAVYIRGTTNIEVRVQGDQNHNNISCPTYSITLN